MAKKRVIQNHHQIYSAVDHPEQERIVKVFKGEHEILSKMQMYTRKRVSRGFISSLALFIVLNSDRAEDI
jgi:hypothetical protein